MGWCAPPLGLPLRLGLETLGVGAPHLAWGASHPLGRRPPLEIGSPRAGAPPRGPIYSGREGGKPHPSPWRLRLPPVTLLPLLVLGEALPISPLLPPPRRRAAGSSSTSPSPLLDQEGVYVFLNRTCVERGGAVHSALGSSVIWITTSTTPSTLFS